MFNQSFILRLLMIFSISFSAIQLHGMDMAPILVFDTKGKKDINEDTNCVFINNLHCKIGLICFKEDVTTEQDLVAGEYVFEPGQAFTFSVSELSDYKEMCFMLIKEGMGLPHQSLANVLDTINEMGVFCISPDDLLLTSDIPSIFFYLRDITVAPEQEVDGIYGKVQDGWLTNSQDEITKHYFFLVFDIKHDPSAVGYSCEGLCFASLSAGHFMNVSSF